MKKKVKCGAYARSTGNPCQAKALANGRCVRHGGMSSGPKTPEGRKAIAEATRQRMASGQKERVLAGFYRWLAAGGRDMLSRLAKSRERRKRWERLMLEQNTRIAHGRVSASWGFEATAPASEFRDQYLARERREV